MLKAIRRRLPQYVLLLTMALFAVISFPLHTSPGIQPSQSPLATAPAIASPTLRSLAQTRNFPIGTAVNIDALRNEPLYSQTLADQFNMVTPETSMKFDKTEPEPGVFTFGDGDAIVAFARAHNIQVRGHNLVWYRALPAWITNGTFTRDQLMTILRDHIMTEVSHYRGAVNIWDVVNEAIDDQGNLRDNIWLRVIGPDYIDLAFQWAHEADPQALLFYNDYGGEGLGHKSDAIYALLKAMITRGVPVQGVGLQMHVSLDRYPDAQDLLANMKRLAALGLQVQITEMDVEIQGDPRPMQARLQAEASIYQEVLSTCLAFKPCTAFVMWGFTDAYSWIPGATGHPDAPLDLRRRLSPQTCLLCFDECIASFIAALLSRGPHPGRFINVGGHEARVIGRPGRTENRYGGKGLEQVTRSGIEDVSSGVVTTGGDARAVMRPCCRVDDAASQLSIGRLRVPRDRVPHASCAVQRA